jgi:hypothetical protein
MGLTHLYKHAQLRQKKQRTNSERLTEASLAWVVLKNFRQIQSELDLDEMVATVDHVLQMNYLVDSLVLEFFVGNLDSMVDF